MTRHIDVYFYKASKRNKDEHVVNLVTTLLDPPYCRRIQFMDSKALAVYTAKVCMRVRDYTCSATCRTVCTVPSKLTTVRLPQRVLGGHAIFVVVRCELSPEIHEVAVEQVLLQ